MTINIKITTVATSIAALSWPAGVTVKDFSNIPQNGILTPGIMYPLVDDSEASPEITSVMQGTGENKKMDFFYDLPYRYLHCAPQGGPGGIYDIYGGAMKTISAILRVFVVNDSVAGAVDMKVKSFTRPKIVADPAGNQFWGADFVLRVQEFTEESA